MNQNSAPRAASAAGGVRQALLLGLAAAAGFTLAALLFQLLSQTDGRTAVTSDAAQRRPRPNRLQDVSSFDPERLLRVRSREDLAALRELATAVAFGPGGLPLAARAVSAQPDADVVAGHAGAPDLRVDRLVIDVGSGFTSTVEHLRPEHPSGVLVVVQQGHVAPDRLQDITPLAIARAGHDVLVLSMPLKGDNPRPLAEVPEGGHIRFFHHNQMAWLERPLRPFLEPVIVAISEGLRTTGASHVAMVGLSGGGWTTVLCAALDERIEWSCSVAGTLPLQLRNPGDWGDFEQTMPEFLRVASYLDLYVLGADTPRRGQLHVYNARDPCCFAGDSFRLYEGAVQARLASLGGGRHENLLDDTHEAHAISPWALERIQAELRTLAAGP